MRKAKVLALVGLAHLFCAACSSPVAPEEPQNARTCAAIVANDTTCWKVGR